MATKRNADTIAQTASAERYLAGRRLMTASGPKLPGEAVDTSTWSARSIAISLSVGEIVHPGSGGARFVAVRRINLGGGVWAEPGQPIPDSQWQSARGPACYLRLGQIRPADAANVQLL